MRFALSLLTLLMVLGALSFCGYNAAMSALFWWRLYAHDAAPQIIFLGLSLGASLFKIGIPVVVHGRGQRWRHNKLLACAWGVALVFDLLSGYGYSAQSAGTAHAGATETARVRGDIDREISDRRKRLARIPETVRPVAVVKADLRPRANEKCTATWQIKFEPCQELFKLQTELAQAEARDALEGEISLRLERIAALPPAKDADPTRALIARLTRTDDDTAGVLKAALMVALIELAPIAVLGWAARPTPAPLPPAPKRALARRVATPQPRRAGSADVAALLRGTAPGADGWIGPVSQRTLAGQLGISAAEVNRQIKTLVADGSAEFKSEKRGSSLKFTPNKTNVQIFRPRA